MHVFSENNSKTIFWIFFKQKKRLVKNEPQNHFRRKPSTRGLIVTEERRSRKNRPVRKSNVTAVSNWISSFRGQYYYTSLQAFFQYKNKGILNTFYCRSLLWRVLTQKSTICLNLKFMEILFCLTGKYLYFCLNYHKIYVFFIYPQKMPWQNLQKTI